ncbi:MAG: hypothetical protein A3J99_03835 [Sideroxydans sp. RIFOXYD2_FULL_59_7]|nr:MAG: hypothetical protein A3J99_03835 [Sideroxydans sp. RIFOXYD2_FULL_59_7]
MVVLDTSRVLPAALADVAKRIVAALQMEAERFSATGDAPRIEFSAALFTRVIDPANQLPGYEGVWRNARKERCGSITFNSDGSFFAEYDIFCPHPRDSRWFVEMVTAWGNADSLSSEATLIPAL